MQQEMQEHSVRLRKGSRTGYNAAPGRSLCQEHLAVFLLIVPNGERE